MTPTGVQMWLAYDIGEGLFHTWQSSNYQCPVLRVTAATDFVACKPGNVVPSTSPGLFPCTEHDCVASFPSFKALQQHLEQGNHRNQVSPVPTMDAVKVKFVKQVVMHTRETPAVALNDMLMSSEYSLQTGWALKKTASASTSKKSLLMAKGQATSMTQIE